MSTYNTNQALWEAYAKTRREVEILNTPMRLTHDGQIINDDEVIGRFESMEAAAETLTKAGFSNNREGQWIVR